MRACCIIDHIRDPCFIVVDVRLRTLINVSVTMITITMLTQCGSSYQRIHQHMTFVNKSVHWVQPSTTCVYKTLIYQIHISAAALIDPSVKRIELNSKDQPILFPWIEFVCLRNTVRRILTQRTRQLKVVRPVVMNLSCMCVCVCSLLWCVCFVFVVCSMNAYIIYGIYMYMGIYGSYILVFLGTYSISFRYRQHQLNVNEFT
jgi:hypothetical protein